MHKFVILFLAMSYSIVSHSSTPTIDDYLDRATPDMYDQYIYGLEGGLEWAQEYTFTRHSLDFFCKPNDLILSAAKLRSLIDIEIEENISFYSKYGDAPLIGLALRNAYISEFSCN